MAIDEFGQGWMKITLFKIIFEMLERLTNILNLEASAS